MLTESVTSTDGFELARGCGHPSIGLVWGEGLTRRVSDDRAAALFSTTRGRNELCLFGAIGPDREASRKLTEEYLAEMSAERKRCVIVQVREENVEHLRSIGARAEVLGRNYSVHLPDFSVQGKALAKVRQNVNRARRDGVEVAEVSDLTCDSRATIDRSWLTAKGRHTKMLSFMVGDPATERARGTRTFVATVAGAPVAYIVYSPTFADSSGWAYDLTRRRPDAPVGVIEAINLHAIQAFRDESAAWLHLGLTPFIGTPAPTLASDSLPLTTLLWGLSRYGAPLYPAAEQERFKLKWNPHVIEPEYLCYAPRFSLRSTYALMSVANMI